MPVFALYNFDEAASPVLDTALGNGAQNGKYINGADPVGGRATLDGHDDLVKISQDPAFQLDRGTLEIQFTQNAHVGNGPNTILSRDSVGHTEGGYRIDVLADGSIQVVHETAGGSESSGAPAGFLGAGDEIKLSYSWDADGAGGQLVIENLTAGTKFDAPVPPGLTMDQGDINQPWIIGAGQTQSNPDILNDIDQHFNGSVEFFSISDTVDNNNNGTPDANPDTATTAEDTAVVIPVLANDTDPTGQTLTVTGATAPNGIVTLNDDGTLTYTPNADFNGDDTITYNVTDPDGNTATSTVTVTVTPVNDAPEANADASTTAFNTPVTFAVLGNDMDVDGDTLAISGLPTSDQGTITVNSDGTLTFQPNDGFTGDATVNYTIVDEEGLTDTTTWTITVGAGTARDGIVSGTAGDDVIDRSYIDPTDADRVDANDAILPGEVGDDDIIRAGGGNDTVLAGAGNDEVDAGDGNDSIDGNAGNDSILGRDGNDSVFGDEGNDTVFGGAGDDQVVGGLGADVIDGGSGNDALQGNEGDDSVTGGLGNDSLLGGVGNDTLTSGDEGSPDQAYPGLYPADTNADDDRDSVIAGAGDDLISTGDDADTILGGDGNDTISAGVDADRVNGGEGADLIVAGEGADTVSGDGGNDVIHGDTVGDSGPTDLVDALDLDDDNNRDSLDGGAGNDSIFGGDDADTLSGADGDDLLDGGIDNDSILGGAGVDTLIGGQGDDTLDGGAGNDRLVDGIGADSATGGADRDAFIGATAGDRVDGSETGDDFDTLDLRGLGPLTVAFDPANAENGTVTFLDATGAATGTMNFVNIENVITGGPVATPDTATTPEDTAVVIPVLGNDTDPDGQPLTVTGATAPNGTVTVNPNGTISYTPNPDFNGTDTISYTVTDPDGNTATSTVTVTVTPVNDAPVAVDDAATTPVDTAIIIPVLGNDTDVDGDTLAIQGLPTSDQGTIVVNGDGTITFTPNAGFTGDATINYNITDGNGGTDAAVVTVTVTPDDTPRDGIVFGTDGGDLIDVNYTGDNDGDFVDRGDAILPGDAPNDDLIYAGAGNDTVRAGLGDDSVRGGAGDDELRGNEGNDSLAGGRGNDTLIGNDGDDFLRGQDGNDSLNGSNGNDTLAGGRGNDTLIGEDGRDLVRGMDGDDVIDTGGLSGLPLPDIDYPGLYPADPTPLNDLDTVFGGAGNDTIRSGDDADLIFGGTGNDNIDGGIDADTIFGGTGNDTIVGGEGADSIQAGQGDDLVFGGLGPTFPDAVNIPDADGDLRPLNGTDTIDGGLGNDTIFGLDDADVIFGGVGNDSLDGGVDNDTVQGGQGNDTIIGGQGSDSLSGGADRDVFVGGGAGDFVDGNEAGDDFDTLDLRGAGPLNIVFADDNPENGTVTFLDANGDPTGTLNFVNIENVIPCFTPGTLIATPRGEVPVESLRAGDKVVTRDNGLQEIRWMGQKALTWTDMAAAPHLRPVLVRQGSLGNGLPERDMMVSPNHRLLVANDRTALYFDEHEVLVSAKHLVGSAGVHAVESMQTTYIHMMFDQHEVVLSNGAWTESFQPGDYTLNGMGNAQRTEIFELFPDLKSKEGLEGYTAARKTLKRHEARLLVR